jgi:hypothetical protein
MRHAQSNRYGDHPGEDVRDDQRQGEQCSGALDPPLELLDPTDSVTDAAKSEL